MAYQPLAPNRLDVVEHLATQHPAEYGAAGHGSSEFTGIVARELNRLEPGFHWTKIGKRGDENDLSEDAIGCTPNDTSPVSDPRTGVKGEVIDIIASSTSNIPSERFPSWNDETEKTGSAGAAWVNPGGAPPTDLVQPTPTPSRPWQHQDYVTHIETLGRLYREEVRGVGLVFSGTPTDTVTPPAVDVQGVARLFSFREQGKTEAQVRNEIRTDLGKSPVESATRPAVTGRAPSLLDFPSLKGGPGRGNFQFDFSTTPHLDGGYIACANTVRGDTVITQHRIPWLLQNGYNVELANAEQWNWQRDGTDVWTRPAPGVQVTWPATDPVHEGQDTFGWIGNLDELIRIFGLYRSNGIEIVCAPFEYSRLATSEGLESDITLAPGVVSTLAQHVSAFQIGWEINEQLSSADQYRLSRAIGAAAGDRPCGPHFAAAEPGWFDGDHGLQVPVLFQQYDTDEHTTSQQLLQLHDEAVTGNPGIPIVAHEFARSRISGTTHQVSRDRAQALIAAGAVASLNG